MRAVLGCVVVAFALSVAGLSVAQDKAAAGMKVFEAQKCGMCHAVAGKGNKKSALDGVGKKLNEAQIKEWIVDPKTAAQKAKSTATPPMKAYPNLPAADLDALVAYVASLK